MASSRAAKRLRVREDWEEVLHGVDTVLFDCDGQLEESELLTLPHACLWLFLLSPAPAIRRSVDGVWGASAWSTGCSAVVSLQGQHPAIALGGRDELS